MSDARADAAPDLELLSAVEVDMNRVEETMSRLLDASVDPAAEVAWLDHHQIVEVASADATEQTVETEPAAPAGESDVASD